MPQEGSGSSGRKDEGHCTLGPSMTPVDSVLAVLEQDSRWQERLCTSFFSSFQAPRPLLIPGGVEGGVSISALDFQTHLTHPEREDS